MSELTTIYDHNKVKELKEVKEKLQKVTEMLNTIRYLRKNKQQIMENEELDENSRKYLDNVEHSRSDSRRIFYVRTLF